MSKNNGKAYQDIISRLESLSSLKLSYGQATASELQKWLSSQPEGKTQQLFLKRLRVFAAVLDLPLLPTDEPVDDTPEERAMKEEALAYYSMAMWLRIKLLMGSLLHYEEQE